MPVVLVVDVLFLEACGTESDGGAEPVEPAVVLGTGAERYEPLEGEPTIALIKGFQGGFHVWASFLTYGFQSNVLHMDLDTAWDARVDSLVPMQGNVRTQEVTDAVGKPAGAVVGWPARIFDPACAHGQRIRLDLTVRDETNGTEASDTRFFIAEVAEADRSTSCSK